MSTSSSEAAPSALHADLLSHLAQSIHRSQPHTLPAPLLVSLQRAGESVEVGFWELPAAGHVTDPVVGFLADPSWDGTGIVTAGRAHRLDGRSAPTPSLTVCLWPRRGEVVSVVGPPGEPGEAIVGRPSGVVADVLARILAQPTPPPVSTTAAFVDATWLERVMLARRPRPGRPRSWRWLADHHPLRGTGPTPPPAELAARAVAFGREHPWSAIVERHAHAALPADRWGPPGGTVAELAAWFDEGSLARWILHHLPPPEVLVHELVNELDPTTAGRLIEALAETDTSSIPPV